MYPKFSAFSKEIEYQSEKIFDMVRLNVEKMVGKCLGKVMSTELTHFLGREPYGRKEDESNYRTGSHGRKFTLEVIGEVSVKVPRDRDGEYQNQVLPLMRFNRPDICA
jgi:putative transposase